MSGSVKPTHMERTQGATRARDVSEVTVESVTQLSPSVKGFVMRAENEALSFKPGQWVDLLIPSVETVGGYSITSAPHLLREKRRFTLAIQHSSHPPTLWMTTQCREGDTLSVRVGGDFFYDPTPSNSCDSKAKSCDLFLMAGGLGINPLVSILLHHARLVELGQVTGRVRLLYSASSVSELLFKEEIDTLCSRHFSWFTAQYFVSRQKLPSSHSTIIQRRIGEEDIATHLYSLNFSPAVVMSYVCGPPDMIDCVTQWLAQSGLPQEHIHTEKWW